MRGEVIGRLQRHEKAPMGRDTGGSGNPWEGVLYLLGPQGRQMLKACFRESLSEQHEDTLVLLAEEILCFHSN